MSVDASHFYFSEFGEVNERFMTLGQILVMLKAAAPGSRGHERALDLLARSFPRQCAFEERLMEGCLYPRRTAQAAAHRILAAQLELVRRLAPDDPHRRSAAIRLLKLLERHLRLEDRELVAFLDVIEDEGEQTVTTRHFRRRTDGARQPS